MPSVQFNQYQALTRALDTNANQKLDELQVDGDLGRQIDSDGNGELSTREVATALQADRIDIVGSKIVPAINKTLQVPGLETLGNIHRALDETLSAPHVWVPRTADNIDAAVEIVGLLAGVEDKRTPAERRRQEEAQLRSSSTGYLLAVTSMRSTLRAVSAMTANGVDARSRQLHTQAESALKSTGAWTAGSLVGGLLFGSAQAENTAIQIAYNQAKTTMVAMREQTAHLPNVPASLSQTNAQIGKGLNALDQIRRLQSGADSRSQQLQTEAATAESRVTGRTRPFAATGAVIGAVAGGAAGYFLNGNSIKGGLIGAGAGAAGAAGLSALIGHGIDSHYTEKARSLREMAGQVKSYDPEQAQKKLDQAALGLYRQQTAAGGVHDLDQALAIDGQIQGLQQQVNAVNAEAEKINALYQPRK